MRDKWEVQYGCEEWQESDSLSEKKARKLFSDLCEKPPTLGLYTATYVKLIDANDETVDSHEI